MAQQSVTKYIAMTVINYVTPKAAAKQELLFNKPVSTSGSSAFMLSLTFLIHMLSSVDVPSSHSLNLKFF